MAIPKNNIGGNLVQPTNIEIASSSAVPPTDGNTNAAVDGSLATTASGLYQRTGGSWQKFLAAGSSQSGVQQEVVLVPNGSGRSTVFLPDGGVITAVTVVTPVALASTGGTITLGVSSGGITCLATAATDVEIGANTKTDIPVSAGAPQRTITAGNHVNLVMISNNADATGGPLQVLLTISPAT